MSFTPLFVFDGNSTDNYQYLRCPGSTHLTLQISSAQVYIGFGVSGEAGGSAIYPAIDEPFLPVVGGIDRPPFDEIRIKSYTPGKPASVKIRAT